MNVFVADGGFLKEIGAYTKIQKEDGSVIGAKTLLQKKKEEI